VEVDRTIFYCAMHSHISIVQNGRRVYLHTLSNTACQRLHETGTLSIGGSAIISRASPNSTTTSSINLAGSTTMDGRCSGTQYSDPYGTRDTGGTSHHLDQPQRFRGPDRTCIIAFNSSFRPTMRRQTRGMPRHGEWINFLASSAPRQLPVRPI